VDQLEEEDGDEAMSATCVTTNTSSSGFPIRALTRAEILRELVVQRQLPEAEATRTNVAALD
jgi:hypothetical protein